MAPPTPAARPDPAAVRWIRDSDAPALELGAPGAFDQHHLFAPCVAVLPQGGFRLWYSGSRGAVTERRFALGVADSVDGRRFTRVGEGPVLAFDDDRSVLTPNLLRADDGRLEALDGRLRCWFSACDFPRGDGRHHLHLASSSDGLRWGPPSSPLLADAYAPSVLRERDGSLRMWYVDTAADVWSIRHAHSADGERWRVTPEPVLVVDQPWEHRRLNYPCVRRWGDRFVLWYSSRSDPPGGPGPGRTAIGLATSADGLRWRKHPDNPVLAPDPTRPWETHYCSTPCVLPTATGWRLWYSTRPAGGRHKYFALATAHAVG